MRWCWTQLRRTIGTVRVADALLALVSVAVTLCVLDIILSLSVYAYRFIPPLEPQGYVMFHPERGFDITPAQATTTHHFFDLSYEIWSNRLGCYDDEESTAHPRVLLVGDSFTWGWTPFLDKWGTLLETYIEGTVLSCGVNAYGTKQALLKATDVLTHIPEPEALVVGYFGANDVEDDRVFPQNVVTDGYRVKSPVICGERIPCDLSVPTMSRIDRLHFWFGRHSALYNLAKQQIRPREWARTALVVTFPDQWLYLSGLLHEPAQQQLGLAPEHYDAHLASIRGFKELADTANAELLFVLIPSKEDVSGPENPRSANETTRPHLVALGIPYVDAVGPFRAATARGHTLYWPFDNHINPTGNHLLSLIVAKTLLERDVVALPYEDRVSKHAQIVEELRIRYGIDSVTE